MTILNNERLSNIEALNAEINTIFTDMYRVFAKYKVNIIRGFYTDFGIYHSMATAIINDPVDTLSVKVIYDYQCE